MGIVVFLSLFNIMTEVRFPAEAGIFFSSPLLEPTQLASGALSARVKQPGREADHPTSI